MIGYTSRDQVIFMKQFFIRVIPIGLLFLLLGGSVNSQSSRLTVGEDLSESNDMKECFLTAAKAAGREDLDEYLFHFTVGAQKHLRKNMAMIFVQCEFSFEVLDCHVIDCSGEKGELAVRYRAGSFERQYDFVAVLDMRCENNYWKINHESVKTVRPSTCSNSTRCNNLQE